MANYTITTTREREAALNWSYERYKTSDQTKEQYFQEVVNSQVLNNMVRDWKNNQSMSLTASVATVPEANEAKALNEIATVITTNGGQIVTVGDTVSTAGNLRGAVPFTRREDNDNLQTGTANKKPPNSSGPDGGGDNKTSNID